MSDLIQSVIISLLYNIIGFTEQCSILQINTFLSTFEGKVYEFFLNFSTLPKTFNNENVLQLLETIAWVRITDAVSSAKIIELVVP